jgi:hypothetical protein
MWKKISVVAGWMAIPFAALAVLTDGFPAVVTPADPAASGRP